MAGYTPRFPGDWPQWEWRLSRQTARKAVFLPVRQSGSRFSCRRLGLRTVDGHHRSSLFLRGNQPGSPRRRHFLFRREAVVFERQILSGGAENEREGDVRKGIADDADIFVAAGRGDPAIAANGLNDDAGCGAVENRVAGDHQTRAFHGGSSVIVVLIKAAWLHTCCHQDATLASAKTGRLGRSSFPCPWYNLGIGDRAALASKTAARVDPPCSARKPSTSIAA